MADKKEKTAYEGQDVVTMDIETARDFGGTAYGPGKGIRVPKDIAEKIKAEDHQAAKGTTQGTGKRKK